MPTQAELESLTGTFPMLKWMMRHKLPLTRDGYILANWGPNPPKHWTAEYEHEIPPFLRDPKWGLDEHD
jgi:hypothetical protein